MRTEREHCRRIPWSTHGSEAARSLDPACRAMVTREGAGLESTSLHTLEAIFDTRFIVSFVTKAHVLYSTISSAYTLCIPSLDSSFALERHNTTNTSTIFIPPLGFCYAPSRSRDYAPRGDFLLGYREWSPSLHCHAAVDHSRPLHQVDISACLHCTACWNFLILLYSPSMLPALSSSFPFGFHEQLILTSILHT